MHTCMHEHIHMVIHEYPYTHIYIKAYTSAYMYYILNLTAIFVAVNDLRSHVTNLKINDMSWNNFTVLNSPIPVDILIYLAHNPVFMTITDF